MPPNQDDVHQALADKFAGGRIIMASNTDRLDLYKVDPKSDGNQTFNIDSMLNDNWDKLEEKVAIVNENGEVVNKDGTLAGGVQSVNAKKGNVAIDKDDVGLSNVDNVKQASKEEFNNHVNNTVVHTTQAEKDSWNAKGNTTRSTRKGKYVRR